MTTTPAPHSWRPDEVRRKQFTVRFRGLDQNEVRGFLNLVADDVQRLQEQITTTRREQARQRDELEQAQDELAQTRAELQQVRAELQEARVEPQDQVTDQAVLLLNQAQQLADALIDEGMQSARDLMVAARSHQREIVSPMGDLDHAGVGAAAGSSHDGHTDGPVSAEIEDVRNFARVAQVQFRAVLEALNEQVNRLGSVSDTDGHEPAVDDHHSAVPMRALNGNGHGYRG